MWATQTLRHALDTSRRLRSLTPRSAMDIFRVQELYAPVPEFVGEEEGDEKTPKDVAFVVR